MISWHAWLLVVLFFFETVQSFSGCLRQAFASSIILNPVPQHWTQRRRVQCTSRVQTGAVSTSGSVAPGAGKEPDKVQELGQLTWIEVEARIKRDIVETGACAIIVPVGATEQHGPNGLIGTDHMTAEAVARGLSKATGTLVAPCINYGMSLHHGDFSGTVTLTPATFVGVVRDVASSLSRSGFTHVLFINGHGGNVGPAWKAFAEFKVEQDRLDEVEMSATTDFPTAYLQTGEPEGGSVSVGDDAAGGQRRTGVVVADGEEEGINVGIGLLPRARLKLINWYGGPEASALAQELYGKEKGQHATPDEVAMTQHIFPASIKDGVALDPAAIQVAKDLGGMTKRVTDEKTGLSVMDPQDFRRRFPDGRMFSNPGLATPEHGGRLLNAAVKDAVEALKKFQTGEDLTEEAAAAAARVAAMTPRKHQSRWGDRGGSGGGRATCKGRWAPPHGARSRRQ